MTRSRSFGTKRSWVRIPPPRLASSQITGPDRRFWSGSFLSQSAVGPQYVPYRAVYDGMREQCSLIDL